MTDRPLQTTAFVTLMAAAGVVIGSVLLSIAHTVLYVADRILAGHPIT